MSLERLGRSDEALQLCSDIRRSDPVDLSILNTLLTVYKYNDRIDDAIAAYETAHKKQPKNDELSCALFFVYALSMSPVAQPPPKRASSCSVRRPIIAASLYSGLYVALLRNCCAYREPTASR